MNRLLIITAVLLAIFVATEQYITHKTQAEYVLKNQLRKLPNFENINADAIREFRIERADTAWAYRWQNDNWHYPAYENVFGLNDRISSFLKDTVENYGTIVDVKNHAKFGFDTTPLTIHLIDSTRTWQQTVQIGASLPGTDTREAYMKVPQSDTIYQIHADPIRSLFWERLPNRPPFVDPKILPSALSRRAIKRVVYINAPTKVTEVERIEIEEDDAQKSPTDGPTYEWHANMGNKRQKVVNASVYTYLSFLGRLKYDTLRDPTQKQPTAQILILIDDQDIADTLEVGKQSNNQTPIYHRSTGHLYTISNNKTKLLFLTPALLDTLPKTTPYQQAEPTGAFSLASP